MTLMPKLKKDIYDKEKLQTDLSHKYRYTNPKQNINKHNAQNPIKSNTSKPS